ncbi:unnamed protein product [Schistosoma curassoni]|uniref:Phosducin domain-containing protein n=1 Tax=Schistosoma curassoni TaxID=6186 RepID=A0A183KNG7_9TREM|nr:unnamed protein product [Schistosoma curassoni]
MTRTKRMKYNGDNLEDIDDSSPENIIPSVSKVNSPISLNLALDNAKLNPKDSCSVGDNYVETRLSIEDEVVSREKEVENIELEIRELQLRKRLLELTPNSLSKVRKASETTESSMSRSRDINPPVTSDRRYTNAHLCDEVQLKTQVDSIKSLFMTASLPKIEVMKFDGSLLKFWTFIKGFKTNIADSVDDDTQRLMYLIHYCEGTAKDAIEHCVLLPEEEVIYYPYLQLPIIHFNIQKRLYLSSVDADSIKSIISAGMLKSLNPDVVIIPTKVSISSITGHKLSIL